MPCVTQEAPEPGWSALLLRVFWTLVQPDDAFIVQPLPDCSLELEVVVYVKDQPFPHFIIVVVREALVAVGDEAIGTNLYGDWRRSWVALAVLGVPS